MMYYVLVDSAGELCRTSKLGRREIVIFEQLDQAQNIADKYGWSAKELTGTTADLIRGPLVAGEPVVLFDAECKATAIKLGKIVEGD